MPFHRTTAVLAASLLAFLLTGTVPEAGAPRLFRIAGEAKDAKGKLAASDELAFEESGVRVTIRYLDAPARAAALKSVLGRELDLFPDRTEASRGYVAFALEISSHSKSDLLFEPGQCRLITDKYDVEFPMEYTAIYELLSRQPEGAPSLEDVQKAVFSASATIRPGGAVRKLLVFPGPRDSRWKGVQVRIGALHLTEKDLDAVFKFRKFKVAP